MDTKHKKEFAKKQFKKSGLWWKIPLLIIFVLVIGVGLLFAFGNKLGFKSKAFEIIGIGNFSDITGLQTDYSDGKSYGGWTKKEWDRVQKENTTRKKREGWSPWGNED